jgi:hypothetical protein
MSARDKIAGAVCLVIGILLLPAAFRPELRSAVSDFVSLSAVSVTLAVIGLYHLTTARDRADRFAQQLTAASPVRRLWLPQRFYTSGALLWQLRFGGAVTLLGSLMLAAAALVAYRRGW